MKLNECNKCGTVGWTKEELKNGRCPHCIAMENTETNKDQFITNSIFDDKIDEWHNSDSPLSLYEYLGLTVEEFKIWLKTPEEIEKYYRK